MGIKIKCQKKKRGVMMVREGERCTNQLYDALRKRCGGTRTHISRFNAEFRCIPLTWGTPQLKKMADNLQGGASANFGSENANYFRSRIIAFRKDRTLFYQNIFSN